MFKKIKEIGFDTLGLYTVIGLLIGGTVTMIVALAIQAIVK